ncbi:MAG: folate family ECF transporter S component [Clostridiales bacterium]|jgi:ECF transporter S component (folate family)|nr:folate family ECF transporter S component [Clostridiales bacterium]
MDRYNKTKRLAMCGILTAAALVLDGILKTPVNLFGMYALKLSLGMAPILFISVRHGPVYGGICGALTDILQAALFPVGAFNPLFTISAFVMGSVPGLFFTRNKAVTKFRLFVAVLCGQVLGSVILSTIFLMLSYGLPFQIIWARAIAQGILIPVYTFIVWIGHAVENASMKVSTSQD